MTEIALEVKSLAKQFGPFTAVDGVSFVVPKGKVIGLLGPNGAGKTTTMHILIGVTLPTGGTITYFGKDFMQHKAESLRRSNFASAYNTLQGRMSVRENLLVFGHLYGVKSPKKRIEELTDYFELSKILDQRYFDLSAGQRTRVNLAKALLNDPELLLLDEPTASLDPDIADKILSLIEELKKTRNMAVLYTSHRMDEVTRICDEVIFLDHGKIVAQDTPLGLTKAISNMVLRLTLEGETKMLQKFLERNGNTFTFETKHRVAIQTTEPSAVELIARINTLKLSVIDIDIQKPTLEDVFLQIARGDAHVAKN